MSEQESNKWNIPYGISYSKLTKIVRVLLQKKGDINKISIDVLLPLSGLHKNFLSTNLSFFKSINIVDGDNTEGYKLTNLGKKYTDALSLEKDEDIKNCSLELITKSHLNDLKIYIETEGSAISKDSILKFIKRNAKISDGPATGNMPTSSSQGTYALMEIFNKAGIISTELLSTRSKSKYSGISKSIKKGKNPVGIKEKTRSNEDNFTLGSDNFSIQISKQISQDDLEFIKTQVLALFEHAKKKIENSDIEENEINDN